MITQTDMYVHVLLPLDDDKVKSINPCGFLNLLQMTLDLQVQVTSNKYFIAVVTEYIRSLGFYKIPIEVSKMHVTTTMKQF